MTHINIEDLERLLAEATAGPWSLNKASCFIGDSAAPDGWTGISGGNWFDFALVVTRLTDSPMDNPEGIANAALIVAAVNALPQLLAAVREHDAFLWVIKELGSYLTPEQQRAWNEAQPKFAALAHQALHPTPREGKL